MSADTPTIIGLKTLQFAWGGLLDSTPLDGICLVRRTDRGTPGPTLCGIDRFTKDGPGWSVGGGVTGPGYTATPCKDCAEIAARDFPNLPVSGSVFKAIFRLPAPSLTNTEGETSRT